MLLHLHRTMALVLLRNLHLDLVLNLKSMFVSVSIVNGETLLTVCQMKDFLVKIIWYQDYLSSQDQLFLVIVQLQQMILLNQKKDYATVRRIQYQ